MKFGKKKSADAAPEANGQPAPAAVKPANGGNGKAAPAGGKGSLTSILLGQVLVVLVVGVLSVMAVKMLVLSPGEQALQSRNNKVQADAALARVEQRVALLQNMVKGFAAEPGVLQAMNDSARRDRLAMAFAGSLPGTQQAFVFPVGQISQQTDSGYVLSFASLDLLHKAERNEQTQPDAFLDDQKQWAIQIAAPVIDPKNLAVVGTVLAIFDTRVLQPTLQSTGALAGELSLTQSIDGSTQVIVGSAHAMAAATTKVTLPNTHWQLAYAPTGSSDAVYFNSGVLWGSVLVVALLGMIGVAILFLAAQRQLRQDVVSLTTWAQKAFSGERVRLPKLNLGILAALGESLGRLAQSVDKRVVKAETALREAKRKPAAPEPARAPVADTAAAVEDEEPLFQSKNVLDIDMLDGDEDVLGLGSHGGLGGVDGLEVAEVPSVDVPAGIFRAYDIRGIVGENLTPEIVSLIGMSLGSEALALGQKALCVGYDGRHSSPGLAEAVARGILSTGCDVIDIGRVPTPVLYFATHHLGTGSGVMITGSHNPSNYNGLKMMLGGKTLSGEDIQKLLARIRSSNFARGQGQRSSEDVRSAYLTRIVDDIAVAAPLKVVLDAGNGIAGELGPRLIEELGCDVVPLYCEVDGDFPNHHPDPGKPANLKDLISKVQEEGADLGLAFDGDGDRLGVVTNTGKIIWPDRLLMLFARDVVSRNPGADIIYDVKCSRRLASVINEYGGRPVMWKTGHSLIKARMKETGALLAGEMSGHIFFAERWFGFDDGLYSAARLLEILGVEDRSSDDVFADFPEDVSTPELNVEVSEDNKFAIVEKLAKDGQFGEASISTIDGIRVDYPDGWGLCRASNTTPVLVLRFEAESEEALERIKTIFREQLQRVAPDIPLNF
ncbi:phosphomannomutase/phosphoglucomutase [Mangrovitalea sediminis]|uniref:phosphomannomutase/phosphoglucomutase n=1 Tax=Mangrovitalea sediminis TaxID=1982043 RepID=UPI000BE523E7|nr:phosphomannomutase/phosphoglucomutase [Mangrovitalea sediminis]